MGSLTKESRKVALIIGLIIFSTFVGFYDRIEQEISPSSTVSVLPKASVLVIPIEGMIIASGTEWNPSIVDIVVEQLNKAQDTKSVKAVVLRVNSPGGTVGASQEIFDAIIRFKKASNKPVVVSIMDVGASGAYWVSLGADHIFAHRGSIVGSLGVITQTMDFTRVPDKYAVNTRTIKAGAYKDMLNPWRGLKSDEKAIVQKMLDNVHNQFKQTLIEQREFSEKEAKLVADGRIFSGEQALRENLIDQVGSLHDAIQYAGQMVDIEDPNIIYPNQGIKSWVSSFRTLLNPSFNFSSELFGQHIMMF